MTIYMTFFFFTLLICLILFVLIRTFAITSKQIKVQPISPAEIPLGFEQRISKALQIKTISFEEENNIAREEFTRFLNLVKAEFPLVNEKLERTIIKEFSFIYNLKSNNLNAPPEIWWTHYEVTPAETDSLAQWKHGPFEGKIENGILFGRGTLDNKTNMFAMLEAVEILLQKNQTCERDIYLCFGHDEEIGGKQGAFAISKWLSQKEIKAEYLLDEGLCITEGVVPNISKPVALVGIAEKGNASFQLSVNFQSGHASMPSDESANRILALAISKFHNKSFRAEINPSLKSFMSYLAPELPFLQRLAFANQWLFKPVIFASYQKTTSGNAYIRTTIATTFMQGGERDNVVPSIAKAVVNCRILPGQTIESTKEKIVKIINDNRIRVENYGHHNNPPAVSDVNAAAYKMIEKCIKQIFNDVIVCPGMCIAGTDSKYYQSISPNLYRFFPAVLSKNDLSSIHGVNESISVDSYKKMIQFYVSLLRY